MKLDNRILFIDGEAIVLDKPGGMPVDAARDGTLAVVNHLDSLRFGFARQPQPVHRLDRDTSGCLLLARNPKAHRRFAAAFEEGRVEKVYLAVVAGSPDREEGVIDLPLAKVSSREGGWRIVKSDRGKPARTRWRCLGAEGGRALIELRPETGRTHQLRVHLADGLGLPILGDPVYGDGRGPLMLHARSLAVARAPRDPVAARAPWPARFADAGFGEPTEAADAPA